MKLIVELIRMFAAFILGFIVANWLNAYESSSKSTVINNPVQHENCLAPDTIPPKEKTTGMLFYIPSPETIHVEKRNMFSTFCPLVESKPKSYGAKIYN